MKKSYNLLSWVLLLFLGLSFPASYAQNSPNRSVNTKLADALALLPAADSERYQLLMSDLVSTGEEGILQLIDRMQDPDTESNTKLEYALNGISRYVTEPGREADRKKVAAIYIKALKQVKKPEVKKFLIRQIGISGKEEALPLLSSLLGEEAYAEPAIASLTRIGTPEVGDILLTALERAATTQQKCNLLQAITKLAPSGAESRLRKLLPETDPKLQEALLQALGRTGTKLSLPDLGAAAKKSGYAMVGSAATASYIDLIGKLIDEKDGGDALKAAEELHKAAEKTGQVQVRVAAASLMMKANPSAVAGIVKKSLSDKNPFYRNGVLELAADYADANLCQNLAGQLKKGSKDVRMDVLNWFTTFSREEPGRSLVGQLDPAPFLNQLKGTPEARKAAAGILAGTGKPEVLEKLADLLLGKEEDVALAREALSFASGDIPAIIRPRFDGASEGGKVAILELFSARKATVYADVALSAAESSSPAVSTAACEALKNMASGEYAGHISDLLESAPSAQVPSLQQALAASLSGLSPDERFAQVIARIDKAPEDKKGRYYAVLASTESLQALQYIVSAFAQKSGAQQAEPFEALLAWGDRRSAPELLAVCRTNQNADYSRRALERYIRLGVTSEMTGENRRLYLTDALEVAPTDELKKSILKQLGSTGSYLGMMLAGKYLDQPALQQAAASAVMDIALANKGYTGTAVRALLNRAAKILDNPDAAYQREAIRKHMAEMPDEEGFVSLFDGESLKGWQGLVENPIARSKMKPEELAAKQIVADETARKHWIPGNGLLMFDGLGWENLCTIKKYGDIEMYVDWRLDPKEPEGDGGIYLRGSPQVQIWNTARKHVGADVGSGGLYNNQKNPSKPLVYADNETGEWNTFFIRMIGDRVSVWMNGVLVVDNTILENYWARSIPIFPEEQIELQAHESKMHYRNIYVKELPRPEIFTLSDQEEKEGFRILFDGSNMHHWTGNTYDYKLEDGCISLDPGNGHGGNLYTKEEFGNFIFRFEFQLTPGANNGLGIRTPKEGDAAYLGMELQILDNEAPVYSDLEEYQYHGSVYGIIPAKRGFLKPLGEWNYQEVVADGDHIKVTLNGTVILDGNIRTATANGTPDKQEHPGLFNKKGYIGFLGHGSPVKFRNIRIKELTSKK